MSEVSVNRTAAGGYCLIIDGTRVAGGKPEFSPDNCFYWWETDKTIGVVDDLVAEVESWKAANEKLRKSIDETCAGWAEAYETLEADNAKLRELVYDMWCDGMCDCDELVAPRGQYHCAQCQYHYRERMRDLGVEVD